MAKRIQITEYIPDSGDISYEQHLDLCEYLTNKSAPDRVCLEWWSGRGNNGRTTLKNQMISHLLFMHPLRDQILHEAYESENEIIIFINSNAYHTDFTYTQIEKLYTEYKHVYPEKRIRIIYDGPTLSETVMHIVDEHHFHHTF